MVFDAAMIVSTLLTFSMNGMCCIYQMQEDEDLRKTIRKDIRVEYERQRVLDLERWAECDYKDRQNQSESSLDQDRRQRLLRQKMDLSGQANREVGSQEREGAPGASDGSLSSDQAVFYQSDHVEILKGTGKHSRSVPSSNFAQRRLAQMAAAQAASSDMNSLLDSDVDENTPDEIVDDDSSLDDVDLH